MNQRDLDQLKQQYQETPIPDELDFIVRKTLLESGRSTMQNKHSHKGIRIAAASVAAAFTIIATGANISPVFAATMGNVPVVGSLVKVLTFREYTMDDGTYHANIKTPAVEGLQSNPTLQNSLNQKYMEENKKLYEEFEAEVGELKKNGGGYLGIDSGYEIKCDDSTILSLGRYVVNTVGSSSTTMKYDTVDKTNQVLITLPSLFQNDKYVEVISKNIRQQMLDQNKADPDKIYWVKGVSDEDGTVLFQNISAEQNFYINKDHQLVISFDKYEVAPGYMGVVDFVIPTDVISGLLVGNDYIR
ncbi:DUF3298 and DUF4163 domain-containing protein [Clostridium merdae]|uniref:DUF3298 and DUF4163 domain-containing protein n=1 Tax=Clostridium merdae TaxID=1958780 RepID=UPI000A26F080|nr:DUF3298 and DUF4163 domain-containing protein [Clostridium merdae]